jgi:hypothetical protein
MTELIAPLRISLLCFSTDLKFYPSHVSSVFHYCLSYQYMENECLFGRRPTSSWRPWLLHSWPLLLENRPFKRLYIFPMFILMMWKLEIIALRVKSMNVPRRYTRFKFSVKCSINHMVLHVCGYRFNTTDVRIHVSLYCTPDIAGLKASHIGRSENDYALFSLPSEPIWTNPMAVHTLLFPKALRATYLHFTCVCLRCVGETPEEEEAAMRLSYPPSFTTEPLGKVSCEYTK